MQKALAPEVSTWPEDNPQLIGSRCADCGATTFPTQQCCPRCSSVNMADVRLPRRGTLVTWTTQGFVPKLPYAGKATAETFTPFGVGLVQLGDVIRVEATDLAPDKAQPHGPRRVRTRAFVRDHELAAELITLFRPADDR